MSAQVISPRGRNDPKLKHGCNYAAKLLRRLGKRAETPASEIWRHCSLATRVRGWSVTRARSHHLCDVPTHCPQRKPRGTACPRANQAQPRRTELRAQLAPFAKPKRCFAMPPARFQIQILADAPSRFELENTDIPWPLRFAGALLISCTTSLRLIRGKRNTKNLAYSIQSVKITHFPQSSASVKTKCRGGTVGYGAMAYAGRQKIASHHTKEV